MPRPKSTGLPKEEEEYVRVQRLLEVASGAFLELGYEAASTSEIAMRARASKQTFYTRFPSKKDLFLAVIDFQTLKIADRVSALFSKQLPIRTLLIQVANELLRSIVSQEHIALMRLVYKEAPKFPEAAKYLIERGPDRGIANLAQQFKKQSNFGVLDEDDACLAAQRFAGLVVGDIVHRLLLNLNVPRSKKSMETRAESAVDAFLKIYAPERNQSH